MTTSMDQAVEAILKGEVVAYPTETCYGLGARADDPVAVSKVRTIKGSSGERPYSVLIPDESWLDELVAPPSEMERALIEHYWPGPLTLLMRARPTAAVVHLAMPLLGLRCSSHPTATELVRRAGVPITATSANLSGRSPTVSEEIVQLTIENQGALVLPDEMSIKEVTESTVLTVQNGRLKIVRVGAISEAEIREFLADQGMSV